MKRKRINRPYIPRREFKFWLRTDREGEAGLIDYIDFLRKTRQFATKVKQGLRLIWSLGEGDTSVLRELFPHIVDQIEYEMIKQESDGDKGGISSQLEEIKKAQDEMRLQLAEQTQKIIPLFDNRGGLLMAGDKPSKLGGLQKELSAPAPDDDDDMPKMDVKKHEATPEEISKNFQNAMANMGFYG